MGRDVGGGRDDRAVTSWSEVERAEPVLAERVRRRFGVGVNKAIATLRRDGSPRISATELEFEDGEVTLGMMGGSVKLLDVRRDPRVAIHSPTIDAPTGDPEWPGDAKMSGRLLEVVRTDERYPGAGFFRLDVEEVVLTSVDQAAQLLVIESWRPGLGYERRTRA
jgi:hypothetical protein